MVKNPPANAGAAGDSGSILGWDDTLEEEMQNTLVLLPGKSHRQRSQVAYSPWGCKESDTTEHICMCTCNTK